MSDSRKLTNKSEVHCNEWNLICCFIKPFLCNCLEIGRSIKTLYSFHHNKLSYQLEIPEMMKSSILAVRSMLAEFLHDMERQHAHWHHVFDPPENEINRNSTMMTFPSLASLLSISEELLAEVLIQCKLCKWRKQQEGSVTTITVEHDAITVEHDARDVLKWVITWILRQLASKPKAKTVFTSALATGILPAIQRGCRKRYGNWHSIQITLFPDFKYRCSQYDSQHSLLKIYLMHLISVISCAKRHCCKMMMRWKGMVKMKMVVA